MRPQHGHGGASQSPSPRVLHLDALVIGSFAPDLPYFVGAFQVSSACHGRIASVVPATLVAALAWLLWRILRDHAVAPLPQPYREFVGSGRIEYGSTSNGLLDLLFPISVLASLAIGAATHIFWDAWTHRGGYFVLHLAPLRADLWPGMPMYNALQHASSVLGLLIIGLVIAWTLRSRGAALVPRFDNVRAMIWLLCGGVGLGALLVRLMLWSDVGTHGLETRLFHAIVLSINCAAVTWLLGAFLLPSERACGDMLPR